MDEAHHELGIQSINEQQRLSKQQQKPSMQNVEATKDDWTEWNTQMTNNAQHITYAMTSSSSI
jgi:hypothetical protein